MFEWNYESGDVTCLRCGAIAMEHTLFEGEAHRNFSDSTEVRLLP
jgi:transcription initiation factor TFIIIB Brf1 subunit/transcription initiation factor TFIIB